MNSVQIFAIARLSQHLLSLSHSCCQLLPSCVCLCLCVCVSVSITYVCQLSRFLRGLMVKSYYVQTTVNKYRYSGMVWCKWLWPHTDGTAAVQCSLTYWNCYVCVLFTLFHSLTFPLTLSLSALRSL